MIGIAHLYIEWGDEMGVPKRIITKEEFEKLPDDEKTAKTKEGKQVLNENFNIFCYLPGHSENGILIFPIASTKIKYFRKWMSKSFAITNPKNPAEKAKLYASVWKVTTAQNENDVGKWYNIGEAGASCVTWESFITGEDIKNVVSNLDLVKMYIENAKKIDYSKSIDKDEDVDEEM
jgi:hypothetical protein